MAKKRTKKDKQKASLRKHRVSVEASLDKVAISPPTSIKVREDRQFSFQNNHDLIKQDLRKTLAITIFILLVLFTIALLYT